MPCVRQPEYASGGQWRHAILTISERDLHFEAPGARVADLKQAQEVVLFIIDSIYFYTNVMVRYRFRYQSCIDTHGIDIAYF